MACQDGDFLQCTYSLSLQMICYSYATVTKAFLNSLGNKDMEIIHVPFLP